MSGQEEKKGKTERILVVCVDRDNDVGRKAGVKTPIIGEQENIEAALKLLLADPEEADANAMFEAVRVCNSLKMSGSEKVPCEVATIAGSEIGGIAADRKLVSELNEVVKKFKPTSLILVTDGYSDEDIIPLIQSRVPVTSVRRVIVKHSETIEETAALFSRYLKMIVEDPRYSRIFMGLPGILMIMLSILALLSVFIKYDIWTWAGIIGLLITGGYLFGKGYGLDKKLSSFFSAILSGVSLQYRLVTVSSLIFGVLLISVGLYQAISQIASNPDIIPNPLPTDPNVWISMLPRIIGIVISASITIIVTGTCVILLGRALGHLLERDQRFWRTVALLIICIWSWKIFNEAADILIDPSISINELLLSIIIGICIAAVSVPILHFASKKYRWFFKENVKVEEQGDKSENGKKS